MEPLLHSFERAAFDAGGPLCSEEHCPDMLYRLLQCATKNEDLTFGRRLQCLIICYGLESSSNFANSLIRLFAVCRRSPEVHQVFCRLPEKNVYAWSALMIAYIKLGQCGKAISLHCQMQAACVEPDGHTFVALLKACANISAWTQGRLIHAQVTEMGLEADLFIGNTLVDLYAKAGSMEDSLQVFAGFQCRDITTWNAVISGFFHCGMFTLWAS
ncbi:hypothetical protein GOP47_0020499 [Adiantum capillus-veneris]|uniref:Pentatricopeptide repeat-containing protein n=1 Tax=Adiantum capillus-veneris TaxID=13818 RepID=A0A9D4U982_ADICA|nr:hypothetical protein GOP47_0020499 [Adiantum capillus-veneris]